MKLAFALVCLIVAVFFFENTEGFSENANSVEIFHITGERGCGRTGEWCSRTSCCSEHACVCSISGNCKCKRKLSSILGRR
uniref:U10-Deinotoxin-Dsu1c_1 n=1 Tax=Deinopis subrufa TaxID=1905329 RepID=A0A4Q8KBA1_DEISU